MDKGDPYAVLGLSPDATLDDIRNAYHQAVLKFHPDSTELDPHHAQQEFQRIKQAYRTLWEKHNKPKDGRKLSPTDMALQEVGWFAAPLGVSPNEPDRQTEGATKLSFPRTDETAVFVVFWIVAIVAAFATAYGIGKSGYFYMPDNPSVGYILMLVLAPILAYIAVVAATLGLLILTRKILWVVIQMAFPSRRALPSAKHGDLPERGGPHELPKK